MSVEKDLPNLCLNWDISDTTVVVTSDPALMTRGHTHNVEGKIVYELICRNLIIEKS